MISKFARFTYTVIQTGCLLFTGYSLLSTYYRSTEDIYAQNIKENYVHMAEQPIVKIRTDEKYEKLIMFELILSNCVKSKSPSYLLKHLHSIGASPKEVQNLINRVSKFQYRSIEESINIFLNSKKIIETDKKILKILLSGIYDFYFSRKYSDIIKIWKFCYKRELEIIEKKYPLMLKRFIEQIENTLYIEKTLCKIIGL